MSDLKQAVALTLTKDIREICKPLSKLGISYFAYTRTYHDGSRIYLTENADWFLSYHSKYYNIGASNKPRKYYPEGCYAWFDISPPEIFLIARDEFGMNFPVMLFEHHKTYNETYIFGSKLKDDGFTSFALSNVGLLKRFAIYFRDKASELIKTSETDRLLLPRCRKIESNDEIHIADRPTHKAIDNFLKATEIKRYPLNQFGIDAYLTAREASCMKLIIQGKTYKESAKILEISPRTFITHVENIKLKLHCRNKSELISLIAPMELFTDTHLT